MMPRSRSEAASSSSSAAAKERRGLRAFGRNALVGSRPRARARPSVRRRRRRSARQVRVPIATAYPPPPWRCLLHVRSCALGVSRTQSLQIEAVGALNFLLEHDLVGKPVSTFPDHALFVGA